MSLIGLNELRKGVVLWPAVMAVLCWCVVAQAQSPSVELVIQKGHSGAVNSVAFSPDGKMLVSGSNDNTIKLWEASSGQLIRTLSGHSKSVTSVAFSSDGKMLASGGRDDRVRLWNASNGQLIRTLSGHSDSVHLKRLGDNQEPYLPAAELFGSFRLAVINNSPVVNGARPTPRYGTIQEVGDEGGDFIFVRRR